MKKRFFSILTALALCLTLLPAAALADSPDDTGGASAVQSAPQTQTAGGAAAPAASPTGTVLTQETIAGMAKNDPLPAGEYYLTSDINLVGDDTGAWPLNITAGNVTIDLNGHVLDLRGSFIYVTGNLTLKDSNTENLTHKFSKNNGLWVWDETNGTETVTGGVITGGSHTDTTLGYGGGVAVASGTFTMEGGSIVGCTAAYGGGVAVTNGTFHMTGGSISGCKATDGGGVCVGIASGESSSVTFTMEGGSIEECKATNGGVYVGGGTFNMRTGGSIERCTATDGGGVYVNNIGGSGTFTMSSGSIKKCTATNNGGGVYQGSGTFTMSSGSIEGCTATDGGGVYVENGMTFTMSSGRITECSAGRAGGGVYVSAGDRSAFTMNGGSITGCKVKVGRGENDYMLNAVHADGTFNNNTSIDTDLLSGINAGHTGNGENDPILIGSVEGLKDFRNRVNGTGSYTSEGAKPNLWAELLCDIVLNDGTFDENGNWSEGGMPEQWTPISSGYESYSGTFDGGGHTIQGLYINSDQPYIGLFGSVKNATIKNLTVTGYVKGGSSTGSAVGGFAGSAEKSTIQNCTNRSNVTGTYQVGGLVGVFDQGSIQNCANLGRVKGTRTDDSTYVGGIVGYTVNSTTMTACYNAGKVSGKRCVGGLLGFGALEMTSCYNVGNVMGTGLIGGLVGEEALHNDTSLLTVDNCYYLDTAAEKALGKADHFEGNTSAWRKTKTEFANGTVLTELKKNDSSAWKTECGYLEAANMTLPLLRGQTADDHTHSYSSWKHTDTEHWKECPCGKLVKAAHSGGSTCDVCGKVLRSSSTGGSSSRPGYTVTVEKSTNGSVSADRKTASRGTTVTITVTPDKGYTLETITVLDKNGNELKLTQKNGKYTFTMPASRVTVTATFMDDNTMLNFFVDVKASDYSYDAVLWAAQNGITSGTDAVHFSPGLPCTRAQIVTFLWRAAGSPVVDYAMNMTDVPEDAYYAEAVRWALSQGITTGTTATTFGPDAPCTRAQAVAFLFRYAAPAAVTLQELVSGFSDAASVPGYALSAMNWALAEDIVQGSGTKLMPNDSCTRAQIVTFLYRTLAK